MKQAIMTSPGVIVYREVPAPGKLKENEVLLRIQKIGICGSDIHVYHGQHPATPYPVVQGHEFSAIVEAVGKNVKNIVPGMRATARPQLVCGVCAPCKRGHYNVCQNLKVQGFQAPGVAQEFFIAEADRVAIFPDSVSYDHGAMIEPVAVASHATGRVSSLKGKNVVVTGAGTIGNLIAQFAKARGASKVLITDISDYRLNIARQCGIDGILNISKNSFEEKVNDFFKEEGFQVGFEAAGVQASLNVLLQYIQKGSEIVIVGVYAENPRINMYYVGEHELKVIGSLMYLHEDYLEAIDVITSEKINLSPLITTHFPFEKYDEAYQFIEEQKDKTMKVIIDL
jgi:2-desacetyl-2-hydroxyethyl bacteriochlorophyllide A dehydrogenase